MPPPRGGTDAQNVVKNEPGEDTQEKMPKEVSEQRGGVDVDLQALTNVVERGCQNVGFILPFIFYEQVALLTKSQRAFFLHQVKYFDDDGEREQYAHDNLVFVATWNKVVHG